MKSKIYQENVNSAVYPELMAKKLTQWVNGLACLNIYISNIFVIFEDFWQFMFQHSDS